MLQYVTRKLECQSIEDSEDDDDTRNIKVGVNVQFDFILNYFHAEYFKIILCRKKLSTIFMITV